MTDFRRASSGNDATATKPSLWRPLSRSVDGFDLDPAAGCEPEQIASQRYTVDEDGLKQPWFGTVWLNPPFSEKGRWYKRLVDQYRNGDVDRAVAVAPVDSSTEWFHDWYSRADVIVFLEGRDHYVRNAGSGGSPSFSTMLAVWNPTDSLLETLDGMGVVMDVRSSGVEQRELSL